MNVIIRLQNLSWSANASDIRQFFKGLQIPEGGVHIVGGQDGDAFIAFSSDEDARQAMALNGGKIKEAKVSLLLSSRAEMQKVIEKARAASAFMTTKMAQQLPSAEAFTNQFVNKKLPDPPVVPTQPQALMANYLQHSAATVAPMMNFQMKTVDSAVSQQVAAPITLATNPQLPLYYAMNSAQDYLKYMSMANAAGGNFQIDNNKMASIYGQDNSKKIENNYPMLSQQQQQQQQSMDYNRQHRSNSRERQRSRSPISRYDDKKEKKRRTRFSSPEKTAAVVTAVNPLLQMHQNPLSQLQSQMAPKAPVINANPINVAPALMNNVNNLNNMTNNAKLSNSIWDVPPPMNLNSYASYNTAAVTTNNNSIPIGNNYSTSNNTQYQTKSLTSYNTVNNHNNNTDNLEIGTCIKVSNIDKETGYGDMRKFFSGLPIGNNDIKFLKDHNGDPTGVALIRFLSSDSKKQAMTKNGWQLKSTQIMITSISEDDFENNLDNSRSRSRDKSHNNKRGYDDTRRDYDRFQRNSRDRSRERSYESRNRDRDRDYSNNRNMNNFSNNNNNRFNDRGGDRYDRGNNRGNNYNNQNNNFNRRDFRRDNDNRGRNFRESKEPEEKIEYIPDENFNVLVIDDIPDKAEADLFQSFPDILQITIDKYTAYCKFRTHETAKAVLENRFLHYIRNKRVFIEKGSELQFDDYAKKYGKSDNPEFAEQDSSKGSEKKDDERSESDSRDSVANSSKSDQQQQQQQEEQRRSRDPRQRPINDRPAVSNSNGQVNFKTDCVLVKNLDPQTTIEEIENFFSDVNIQRNQMRTHILLDKKGQPCGDCFVEFKFENDVQKATSKNNQDFGSNKVQVMPIPREQVEAVLSSFGDDNRPNRQQAPPREWAPPNDFGSPDCVVLVSNLCYRASIDDILDEFREFDLKPDQIIRRYNDMGQPTGNACINFNSPADASKACDEYNRIRILNRPIWLRRL